jgi:hypothetical protein
MLSQLRGSDKSWRAEFRRDDDNKSRDNRESDNKKGLI